MISAFTLPLPLFTSVPESKRGHTALIQTSIFSVPILQSIFLLNIPSFLSLKGAEVLSGMHFNTHIHVYLTHTILFHHKILRNLFF